MRGDAKPAQTSNVLDHVSRFSAERIWRGRHGEHDVVAARGADLHAVQAQDSGAIRRRIRLARRVAVVGEHDELQPGARGRGRNLVGSAAAVRSVRVDVKDAGNRAVIARLQLEPHRGQRKRNQNSDGGHNGRRHEQQLLQIENP